MEVKVAEQVASIAQSFALGSALSSTEGLEVPDVTDNICVNTAFVAHQIRIHAFLADRLISTSAFVSLQKRSAQVRLSA